MKKFIVSLLLLAMTGVAHAELSTSEKYQLNNQMGGRARLLQLGTLIEKTEKLTDTSSTYQGADGTLVKRVARFTYDVAVDGGSIAAHTLGVSLPANAMITRSYFYTVTQFVDAGSGTVALSCEDANNIKTATDITGNEDGTIVEGESTGAVSAFKASIAAACEITATVAGAEQTAGKLIGFVEYVVVE